MNRIIKWFKKIFEKEFEGEYPYEYAIVRLTRQAKEGFINDSFNKVIVIVKNGIEQPPIDYSPEELKAIKEVRDIPVVEEKINYDYDYDEEEYYGEVVRP